MSTGLGSTCGAALSTSGWSPGRGPVLGPWSPPPPPWSASGPNCSQRWRTASRDAAGKADEQRKRISDFENERRKLLLAHLAGAIPIELLKEEQDRITRQMADAGASLATSEVDWGTVEANINGAIALAERFEDAYRSARPEVRRRLNQVMFEELRLDVGQVTCTRLAEPFAQLLAEDLMEAETRKTPTPILGGSNPFKV